MSSLNIEKAHQPESKHRRRLGKETHRTSSGKDILYLLGCFTHALIYAVRCLTTFTCKSNVTTTKCGFHDGTSMTVFRKYAKNTARNWVFKNGRGMITYQKRLWNNNFPRQYFCKNLHRIALSTSHLASDLPISWRLKNRCGI